MSTRKKAPSRRANPGSPEKRARAGAGELFPAVGIGASAGGLEACRKLVAGLPKGSGMALVIVQHLDPTHESMMVDLLADHTTMTVQQATDETTIEIDHVYVIPPGTYLSVSKGALHLTKPGARHGARLPFDFLLNSMSEDMDARAVCVVLSGTGADGSIGLKAVKDKGGLVIAQDPDEAAYDGMPRSAVMTGAVDFVLPVAKIPGALIKHQRQAGAAIQHGGPQPDAAGEFSDADRRTAAHADHPRFQALQDRHTATPDRAAHGDEGRQGRGYRALPCDRSERQRRTRMPRQGPAHQRHELFPRQ